MSQVIADGLNRAWRDEFTGAVLNTGNWKSGGAQPGSMTATVASSKVTIATGTVSGDELELVTVDSFRAPCRIYVVLDSISQRIANQEFSIELVEEGAADDGGNNRVGVFFSGTVVSKADLKTWSQGDAGDNLLAQGWNTTASPQVVEIDLTLEETWFYTTSVDFSGLRSQAYRLSRKVPDPNKKYKVRIRAKNTGVPASGTNFVVDSVFVESYTHLPTEIIRGRGSSIAGEELSVVIPGWKFSPDDTDGMATQTSVNKAVTIAELWALNGTSFDRLGTASAANLAAQTGIRALIAANVGNWTISNSAAANTQATVSKAAVALTRHVCTGFTATLASGSTAVTVPATPVKVQIRDGATGAGTVIWESYISVPTTAGSCFSISLSDLSLVGSVSTAMTIEFSAAGGAGSFESVSLSGYSTT